jgi:hypothetical protein
MLLSNVLSSLWETTTASLSSLSSLLMEDFCRPKEEGKWATQLPSGFGAYTPCLVDSFVVTVSNLLLLCVTLYRIYYVVASSSSSAYHNNKKFKLKNPPWGHLFAILLVACCVIGPLLQVVLGISNVNLDGELSLPPYEVPLKFSSLVPLAAQNTHTHTHKRKSSLSLARAHTPAHCIKLIVLDAILCDVEVTISSDDPKCGSKAT